MNQPDHYHLHFLSGNSQALASEKLVIRDHRLLSPESFEIYPLLRPFIYFLFQEVISHLQSRKGDPLFDSELVKIFTQEIPYLQMNERVVTYHQNNITFPTPFHARTAHRLIASLNGREGILSDLFCVYLSGTDLVPVIQSKKRKEISEFHVPDDRLFSTRTKKRAKYFIPSPSVIHFLD